MEHSKNATGYQPRSFKPNLDYQEDRRRSKLHAVLRDVRRVLDHDGITASPDLAGLVTLTVAEIATIERVNDPSSAMEYVSLIELRLAIDPWDANALWRAHAVAPIQSEANRWAAHVEQARRRAEPAKFHHAKLIDPAAISTELGLSRKRIHEIFGAEKCALPPVAVRVSRFSNETLSRLRALSKEIGRTAEYLGDILQNQGEDALQATVAGWQSDMLARTARKRKRGRKPDPDGVTQAVRDTVSDPRIRKSESTIWRRMRDRKGAETPESDVTMTVKFCHDDSEIVRSAIPDFTHVFVTETPENQSLEILADIGMTERRGRRNPYRDRDKIIAWWQATRGETPTPERIRKWSQRGQYVGYALAARAWASLQEIDLEPITAEHHIEAQPVAFDFGNGRPGDATGTILEPHADCPAKGKEAATVPAEIADGRR